MAQLQVTVEDRGENKRLSAAPGQTLLQVLRAGGVYLPALCGGAGTCGKCRVRLIAGQLAPTDADRACFTPQELAAGWRLACRAVLQGDVTLALEAKDGGFSILTQWSGDDVAETALTEQTVTLAREARPFAERFAPAGESGHTDAKLLAQWGALAQSGAGEATLVYDGRRLAYVGAPRPAWYAVAADIGTTTIGMALVELKSGRVVDTHSQVNRQRGYGADVISRIMSAQAGHLPAMRDSVRAQLAEGMAALCEKNNVQSDELLRIAIAGNTTMLHLLLGLPCGTLGSSPFTPVSLACARLDYGRLFTGEYDCPVDLLPGFSAYVGADIMAGALYTGLDPNGPAKLLLDVGTNGEMILAGGGRLLCTSTAAGPALEGGKIKFGIGSVPGAIAQVRYENNAFSVDTIAGKPPIGICGSGVVDAVYQGLQAGIIDETGRMEDEWAKNGMVLAKTAQGEAICFTQQDVREVQLAKSAIRAGLETLITTAKLDYSAVECVYLAGGFGNNLNVLSTCGIGLLPPALSGVARTVGNSALGGTVRYLLRPNADNELDAILSAAKEFNLASDPTFNNNFVEYMGFEEFE